MAPKKKGSKDKAKAALDEYIKIGAEYAVTKRQIDELALQQKQRAELLREKAFEAGLHKSKKQPEVTDDLKLETRFTTKEFYDTDRLYLWLKKRKLKSVLAEVFEEKVVQVFDKKAFERLEEAGEIPDVEELEEGDDPIYHVEDATPALYVHDIKKPNAKTRKVNIK